MNITISICVIVIILMIISIYKDIKNRFTNQVQENNIILKDESIKKERSRRISQNVKDKVWNRDGGVCVNCGSMENLEFDHIIPFSKGGANTYRNIQLLCEQCNRQKSNKIG
jgi:CRISPR/Cas system Type II protein with McrA/HNH and RuvC-like nuclease domain